MNESASSRFRICHAALTMAEYFRDDEKRDVLLLKPGFNLPAAPYSQRLTLA